MLGWRPHVIYKYLWKYICLLAMLGLLVATTVHMIITPPTYRAWNEAKVWRKNTSLMCNTEKTAIRVQYCVVLLHLCFYF